MASVKDIAPPYIEFHRAADWGIEWKRPPVSEGLADPETYIHHGAGSRMGNDHGQAMRNLQAWYHDVKNYSTVAYDVMVHRNLADGTIGIMGGREGWLSAATADRNDIGEAICLFGYFSPGHQLSEQPTAGEVEALAFAVAWSIEMGWSALNTKVMGHRDNPAHPGATGCPGDYLYPHVPWIGRRAIEILQEANQPQESDMTTLPKPRRVFDSRKTKAFAPGETRMVDVGPGISEAFVNVTAVGLNGSNGYLSVNDPSALSSILNYSGDDARDSNGVPVFTPNGQFAITNTRGVCHVIVDVMQQK